MNDEIRRLLPALRGSVSMEDLGGTQDPLTLTGADEVLREASCV